MILGDADNTSLAGHRLTAESDTGAAPTILTRPRAGNPQYGVLMVAQRANPAGRGVPHGSHSCGASAETVPFEPDPVMTELFDREVDRRRKTILVFIL